MTATSIIEDLHRRGIVLSIAAGKLRVDAPRGVLTAELLAELKAHKAELLALLTGHRPAETVPEPQTSLSPALDIPPAEDDDRRRCTDCARLGPGGLCLAASRGEILASRTYRPVPTLPRRCEGYMPGPDDPDRRPGPERWPGLVSALGERESGR